MVLWHGIYKKILVKTIFSELKTLTSTFCARVAVAVLEDGVRAVYILCFIYLFIYFYFIF